MKNRAVQKVLATALTGVVAAGMLAGCGSSGGASETAQGAAGSGESAGSGEESGAAEGAVDLSFYIWSDEENYISKVVEAYNASQDKVHVTLTSVPNDSYDDKLKVLLAGQSDVDIVDIRGMAQASTYAAGGALLDLTDRLGQSGLDTGKYGDMWETSTYNDKHYVLPTRTTCWALFYNADLIAEAGMEAPGQMTWSEYGAYADQLRDYFADKTAEDGSPIYGGYWVPWIYQFASVQHGVYVNDENTEYLKESLELPNGEWCVNMLMQAVEEGQTAVNWEVAPMPVPDGVEAGTSWGQFQFAGITSTCQYPDEAFDFLTYLCGEEGAQIYASAGMIHAYATDGAADALKEASGKESVQVLFEAKKVQEQPNTEGYDEYVNAFNEQAQLYFLGEQDIDTTMANFTEAADALRAAAQ